MVFPCIITNQQGRNCVRIQQQLKTPRYSKAAVLNRHSSPSDKEKQVSFVGSAFHELHRSDSFECQNNENDDSVPRSKPVLFCKSTILKMIYFLNFVKLVICQTVFMKHCKFGHIFSSSNIEQNFWFLE
jgi:hypothetical protein